jgi:hypothetical protein
MPQGTRTLAVLVALAVTVAVGCQKRGGEGGEPTPVPTAVAPPTLPPSLTPTPVCRPNVTPGVTAHDWKLTVGPDACTVTDDSSNPVPYAVVSRGAGHKIMFRPSNSAMSLAIVIHAPASDPKPFKNLTWAGLDPQGLAKWLLVCDDPHGNCSTGPAGPNAVYGCYKYDQILDGKECDAGIIIEQ